ncbi:MAG: type II toxin-antitoxin system prevent-host-death family antitoxin [Pyrinomonadaceae bacterium]|nr:type II toxin-antitoxin system prevent-host-death family antitoxin [Pyrinomonadaceae bacterium]
MSYTIAEAKANWDSLLSKAEQGQPQVIMRRKREVAMVVSIDDWHEMVGHQGIGSHLGGGESPGRAGRQRLAYGLTT